MFLHLKLYNSYITTLPNTATVFLLLSPSVLWSAYSSTVSFPLLLPWLPSTTDCSFLVSVPVPVTSHLLTSSTSFFHRCTSNLDLYYFQHDSSVTPLSHSTEFWPLPPKNTNPWLFSFVSSPHFPLYYIILNVTILEFRLKIFLSPVKTPLKCPPLLMQHALNDTCYFTAFHADYKQYLTHVIYIIRKKKFIFHAHNQKKALILIHNSM